MIVFIIVASIAVAVLRIFGWDPFNLIDWAIGFFWGIIDAIARWIESTRLSEILRP